MRDSGDLLRERDRRMDEMIHEVERMKDGHRRLQLLQAALELDVFAELLIPATAQGLAERRGWDPVMTGMLLSALAQGGLLLPDGEAFVTAKDAMRYLVRSSPCSQVNHLGIMFKRAEPWRELARVVREGPIDIERSDYIGEGWMLGMAESAMNGQVGELVRKVQELVPLDQVRRMLDLGGGHGLYAIGFQYLFPGLQAAVFDLPQMAPYARRMAEEHEADISVVCGDYFKDPLPGGMDLVLCSYTRAGSDPDMLPRIRFALREGGHLVVRRHSAHVSEDAMENLEWNLYSFDGRRKGAKRWEFATDPPVQVYLDRLEKEGFRVLHHGEHDEMSELIIARKGGA